jgi:peptidoglycan/LPS O-acetylase OafA/YrhL
MIVGVGGVHFELKRLFSAGWIGVDLFFVLSGFLLGYHALTRPGYVTTRSGLLKYFRRRFLRVAPAFYVQMLFVVGLGAAGVYTIAPLTQIVASLMMAQNFFVLTHLPIFPVWWSLPIEFDFYLLLPLLVLPLLKQQPIARYVAMAVFASFCFEYLILEILSPYYKGLIHELPARLQEFCGGLGTAAIWARHPNLVLRARHGLFLIGACLLGLLLVLGANHFDSIAATAGRWETYAFRPLLALACSLFILAVCARDPIARVVCENRVVLFLGTISYSLYLWHALPLWLMRDHSWFNGWGRGEFYLHIQIFSYGIAAAILVATTSYFAFERPFLEVQPSRFDWRRKIIVTICIGVAAVILAAVFAKH